jgi:hypothetical protein
MQIISMHISLILVAYTLLWIIGFEGVLKYSGIIFYTSDMLVVCIATSLRFVVTEENGESGVQQQVLSISCPRLQEWSYHRHIVFMAALSYFLLDRFLFNVSSSSIPGLKE